MVVHQIFTKEREITTPRFCQTKIPSIILTLASHLASSIVDYLPMPAQALHILVGGRGDSAQEHRCRSIEPRAESSLPAAQEVVVTAAVSKNNIKKYLTNVRINTWVSKQQKIRNSQWGVLQEWHPINLSDLFQKTLQLQKETVKWFSHYHLVFSTAFFQTKKKSSWRF